MSGIFEKLFGVFLHILEILGIFLELFFKFLVNFSEFLGIFLGKIVCEDFLRGLLKGFFWEEFFFYIGIDLFVKILSQGKEGKKKKILIFRSASASISHLKRFGLLRNYKRPLLKR